ncbi:TonB-dependent outer membrane receptor protein, RagA/SusC family [Psychroflexus torquis ATCC 700755]|uniref:TonB-dependent outer membrane receptor protein, RagA/SusC family n=1 Tax=Psychroflexus torquis (strain ATCC 700755 / CIP 106069 / ACAM 623) TaxID=313595 RepID=K4IC65_PSYTT|nr:SusC/RagA family TonB-linked outer membrane protein [Psychroflexus torquis]AFU67994.1 TonB-dependent outer membrane receptor protein, RagA/SusC family [Psychroflexus torquis ATCC 700755]
MRTKLNGILTLILVLFVQITFAQTNTVTGTVTDPDGLPLPGVNILIKGDNTGTQTNFDGNYSIQASSNQTLIFRYVGFTTKNVKVGNQLQINVSMAIDSATLDEVVITGYSNRNQTVATSASVSISAEEIAELSPTTSIDNLLQGKAAGVQVTAANGKPGQGAFVRIRGVTSLAAGASSPLYLVDGAPIREQDLASIPNSDIANIEILKDASRTARYGSRGASGVVIITTKSGNRNKDAKITFNSRFGETQRVEPNFKMMNAQQKLQYESEMFALGISGAGSLPGVTTEPGSVERQFLLDNQTDWEDLTLRKGIVQSNAISVSGGADKMDYFFSAGHDRNTGIIDQLGGFERINTRLNVNFDAKEWLKIGVSVGYSRSTSDEPRDRNNVQNPFRAMLDYNPYETEFVLDDEGNPVLDANGDPEYSTTSTGFNNRGALLSEPSVDINNLLSSSFSADILLSDSFTYSFRTSINSLNFRSDGYSKPGGILDALIGSDEFPGNKLDNGTYRFDLTVTNSLNYNFTKGKNTLNVLGLYEYNLNEFRSYSVRSRGFTSPLLTTQINAAEVTAGNTRRSELALVSYGLFADYDFDQKYLFTASGRVDGSSNFGSGEQYGFFFSTSAGYDISKESFFDVASVDELIFRGSYGTTGNRAGISRYASQGTVGFGSYPGGSATVPANIANPALKWETSLNTNIGVQLSMFNGRLTAVSDYFIRDTEDLLFQIPRADEAGVGSVAGNLGEIQNKGLEISLRGDIIRNDDITWTVGGNVLFLDTEIVSLPDGEDIAPNSFNILYREGSKINEHYLVRWAGVDPATGRSQYLDANDNVVFADALTAEGAEDARTLQGKSTIADVEGGFYNVFRYKNLSLRGDFVFKSGNWINNFVRQQRNSDGDQINSNQATSAFNYWKQPGDTNVQPNPRFRQDDIDVNSDRFLEKGDYIRLRNVTLSYNFSKEILDKTPFSSVRLYAQGQNLLTFSDFYGDPEVGLSSGETISFANSVAPGEATLYSYPNLKSFQMGLDISF